jgi:signal transduction histidine kinase
MRLIRRRHRESFWVAVYLSLVLIPAMLLGWFSLRAVQNERDASRQRILEDNQRYARFASRIVHQELESLAESWASLVPRAVGWEDRLDDMQSAVLRARGHAYVEETFLLHVSGAQLVPPDARAGTTLVTPDAQQARRFRELLQEGENAAFEAEDLTRARSIYQQLLDDMRLPRLQAIALAHLGRVALAAGDWQEAVRLHDRLLAEYPTQWDLQNRPLAVYAMLARARALQELGQRRAAAVQLVEAWEWLVDNSGTIGELQFDLTRENIESRLLDLLPSPLPDDWQDLAQRLERVRQEKRQQPNADYYAQKLSRKLARAWLDELPYSTPLRFVSDASDGTPFLLAYFFLPDVKGTGITGLVGLQVDLTALAEALLPDLLRQVELAEDLHLAVVDDNGKDVLARTPAPSTPTLAREALPEPFGFWSVSVRSTDPGATEHALDIRTSVLLYGVLVLLVTIIAGVVLVVVRLRRERRLSQQKTSFVSSVSHELRTPLTSIRMFAEMLEASEPHTNPKRRGYLQTIRRECDRLQRLIESILDFTALEQGTRRLQLEYEEIGELVRAVAEDTRAQAEQAGFSLGVDIQEDLPEIRVDADAVRQIVLNLLSNAMKYSTDDRRIEVRVFSSAGYVGVQVRDHGIGIAPEDQERIFDDFYRVDTSVTTSRSGLGLGLTLVRGLVRAHGGQISVESALHEGACFTVWLPRSADSTVRGGGASETLAAKA